MTVYIKCDVCSSLIGGESVTEARHAQDLHQDIHREGYMSSDRKHSAAATPGYIPAELTGLMGSGVNKLTTREIEDILTVLERVRRESYRAGKVEGLAQGHRKGHREGFTAGYNAGHYDTKKEKDHA